MNKRIKKKYGELDGQRIEDPFCLDRHIRWVIRDIRLSETLTEQQCFALLRQERDTFCRKTVIAALEQKIIDVQSVIQTEKKRFCKCGTQIKLPYAKYCKKCYSVQYRKMWARIKAGKELKKAEPIEFTEESAREWCRQHPIKPDVIRRLLYAMAKRVSYRREAKAKECL